LPLEERLQTWRKRATPFEKAKGVAQTFFLIRLTRVFWVPAMKKASTYPSRYAFGLIVIAVLPLGCKQRTSPPVVKQELLVLKSGRLAPRIARNWAWKDSNGQKHDWSALKNLLDRHKAWVDSKGQVGTPLNVEGCELNGVILDGVDLREARFMSTKMREAWIVNSDLRGAVFLGVDLRNADLGESDMSSSYLDRVNLEGADLTGVKLANADLKEVDLKEANLWLADLALTRYEPISNPPVRSASSALSLDYITYRTNPDALVQLRKMFKDGGFVDQERKVTYAIKKREAGLKREGCTAFGDWRDCVEYGFNVALFDWTCHYGMSPGRALEIWVELLSLCWLVYAIFIHIPGESGIYRLTKVRLSEEEPGEKQIRAARVSLNPKWKYPLRLLRREGSVVFWAGFFSLMSAFNIGFRDINFGRWLRLLPRTEYDLKAKGWARTVAGVQSLISVYLIALWLLTYFGRPFE
jgi:pentapeptide repeat protein